MIPFLAQATQPLSHETMGMIGLALMLLTRWLWDYNRQRREEEGRVEPKSNPPLHERFASREELRQAHGRMNREREEAAARFARIEAEAAAAGQRTDAELHAIRESIEESAAAGEARVERLREKMDEQTNLIISVIRKEGA
jgi:hypothetical protein